MATTITANGINFPDGSASAPSIGGTDTNTGLFTGSDIVGFATGGNERLRIHSNGRVSIGTSSASGLLHLQDGDNTIIFLGNSSYDDGVIQYYNGSVHLKTGSSNGDRLVQLSTAGSERLRIDANGDVMFHNYTDNIGSNSSGEGFEFRRGEALRISRDQGLGLIVNRTSDDGDLITLRRDGSGKADLGIRSNALTFDVAGSERLRIDSSGRLLIGGTSSLNQYGSQSYLQVQGTGFNASTIALRRDQDNANPPGVVFAKSRSGSLGGNTIVQDGDSIGTLVYAAADGTDLTSIAAQIKVEIDGTPGSNDTPGRIVFETTADGASTVTERLRIDSSGRVLMGTTTEGNESADELTVSNSGNTGITVRSTDSSNCSLFFSDATSGASEYAGYVQYMHSNDSLKFGTGTSERLVIDSSGNVGIGCTPAAQLHLAGPSEIRLNNATDAGNWAKIKCFEESSNNHAILAFSVGSGEALRIANDGKVGINETTPVNKLTISSTGQQTDAVGTFQIRYTGSDLFNAGLTTKNYHGTSQFMQWSTGGLRIGSRILTNSGNGTIYFTTGNDSVRAKLTSDGLILNGTDTSAANALDDYEDGTWTPNPHDGSVTSAAAKYRKIGNQVTIWAQLLTFSDTSTNDQIRIKGLPYAPSSGWHGAAGAAMMQEVSEAKGWIAFAQTDQVRFYASSTGGYAQLRHNELDSGHQIYFTATYPVN